nr:uncharacterized mitochondrial protein AtMg00810-like [Tanacetum cinerariifolium]
TQFDLRPHMESDRWPQIYAGIWQHLQKIYNGKKAALKERYWVPEEDESYDLERIRRGCPSHISKADWDAQLAFWNDPKNLSLLSNLEHKASHIVALRDYSVQQSPCLTREFEALMHEKFQMSAMGELNFFLGLQVLQKNDGIFLSQDKHVGDILKKFGYSDVRSSNTPMDKENPWGKDRTGKDIDLYLYISMIGSLKYLTASRPDIMFAVYACARH